MNFYDVAYSLGLAASSPVWGLRQRVRAKVRLAFEQRMGDVPQRASDSPAIMIHAVSVGEINATRALIDELRANQPELQFIVSTTTQTGHERGLALYSNTAGVTLIRYPLDFSSAIVRLLDRLKPSAVVLMELEIWPNFLRHCWKRKIPVILANGRITEPSYKRYRMIRPVAAAMLQRLSMLCAQDETYATRFLDLGAPTDRTVIAGTMKFDTATVVDQVEGAPKLASDVGLDPAKELIWVCGSTGPGEEEIALNVYLQLKQKHPTLRLAIIPRHPPRFDEVAQLIESKGLPITRRSLKGTPKPDAVVLGDTMGELRKFYSLASVVFVGRSLVDLGHRQHGSDMIEPAALAKAVVVGPFTTNFADAMLKFKKADAMIEVASQSELLSVTEDLLKNPDKRIALGNRAQEVVKQQKGSTKQHAAIILDVLARTADRSRVQ